MFVRICSTARSGRGVPRSVQFCCQRATTGSTSDDAIGLMITVMNNLLNCMPAYHRGDRWKHGQPDTLRRRTRSIGGNPPKADDTRCRVYEPCPRNAGRRRWGVASYGSVPGRHARHDTTHRATPANQGATHLTLHGTSDMIFV